MSGFILGIFISAVSFALLLGHIESQNSIIEHGCGQYNSQTAKFEWLEQGKK